MQNLETVLELKNIRKEYPSVVALNDFSVEFARGEVHALIGENGAGKSTLIKAIAGAITPDKGTIICGGKEYKSMTPALSRSLGIEVVYQEFNLVDPLTAAENISLGEKHGALLNRDYINKKAQELFDQFKTDISPTALVRDLPCAHQQIVEITKAISKNVNILILDEPSAPLTVTETGHLFEMIDMLKKKGVTIIYISHRLDELFAISDRITVMRDGQFVETVPTAECTKQRLIALMVGRELNETYPDRTHSIGECTLDVENIKTSVVNGVSFQAHAGEVLGISGLVGSGRTETVRAIFGADKKLGGKITVHGKEVRINSPKDAIEQGIGLIPEDRKHQGAFLRMSILWNSSIVNIKNLCKSGVVSTKKELEIAEEFREKLKIRTSSLDKLVGSLSGGNQQKVVIAKTLSANSDIIIFDEPTRGIDVGARYEIYLLMNHLASEGKTIIMITSDMEELLGMSDRILVFAGGRVSGELSKAEFSQTRILELASEDASEKGDIYETSK